MDAEALFLSGDLRGALDALDAALTTDADNAALHRNRSTVLLRLGRVDDALAAARRAVALAPEQAHAHAGLGEALRVAGRVDEAFAAIDRALAVDPSDGDALLSRGLLLQANGQVSGAIAAYRRALEVDATRAEAWCNLGVCQQLHGNPAAAVAALQRALALRPDYREAASNLLMSLQYEPQASAAALGHAAATLGALWSAPDVANSPAPPAVSSPARSRAPLRVGYVSADFRAHPVGWFLRDVLAAHDPRVVTVHCYANQHAGDAITASIRDTAGTFVDVAAMRDDVLHARIRDDGIDVLVDLSGHTAGNRLGVFARRAAPVQVAWLGYFASTGLAAMDAVLVGERQAVDGAQEGFTERLVRLRCNSFCYRGPDDAPAPACRDDGPLTFASFNNTAKLNDTVLEAWAALLGRVPDARLLLKWRTFEDAAFRAHVHRRFARLGVDPARVLLHGASPHAQMLAGYAQVDVALDPFPFSGALTTCEALWMGVPVVTLPWQRPVSRQSLAILEALGLDDLVARDVVRYVDVAAALAADVERRRALRTGLRQRMRALADDGPREVARELERVFHELARMQSA